MLRNILTFGLTLGTILCISMIIMINMMYSNPDLETNDVLGHAFMVVVFSLVFFGIRNHRNKVLDGFISFGKAFKIGFFIALIASTLYVVVWLFYYYLFVPDFIDIYTTHVLNQCTTDAEIAAKTAEMASFKEMYGNPLFVILITYFEVLPLGVVIALISSLILKKKQKSN